jgi:hypothetical protein
MKSVLTATKIRRRTCPENNNDIKKSNILVVDDEREQRASHVRGPDSPGPQM